LPWATICFAYVLTHWKRALALGFLSWLLPLLVLILVAAPLRDRYFRDLAMYYSEIGAAYLVYPAFLTLSVRTVFRRPQSL
jgi:hypothetical protein